MSESHEPKRVFEIIPETKEQRRTRLIEQYVGELYSGVTAVSGLSKYTTRYQDAHEIVELAKIIADAVIKATEEK